MTVQAFEAVIAQYGVPDENGDIMTEQAALSIFNYLKQQETVPLDIVGYSISHVYMEGNRERGKVIAIFQFEAKEKRAA